MPPLTIVSSDRPETLIERLTLDLGTRPLGPFEIETVIVQSGGTERWIRNELARRTGCAASLNFPFAATFFRTLATSLLEQHDDRRGRPSQASTLKADPFTRDTLAWRILDLLESGFADEAECEPLRTFVGTLAERDSRKLLGLAQAVAVRFEEYQLYRPDLLLAWEADDAPAVTDGAHARWERCLWRRLGETNRTQDHIARLYVEAIDILRGSADPVELLPKRLSVFGVNTLPPVFVELLHATAWHIPVRFYLQAPRRASWSSAGAANPLWATFGRVTRELVSLLEKHATKEVPVAWEEHHAMDDRRNSILARLQSDARTGVARGRETGSAAPMPLAATPIDESLAVHQCHSPMREMEVLRDQLLAAFAADSTLRPHDVMLLVPDVGTYAPFVEAVFGVVEPGLPFMPHRIADRPIAQESRLADAALRILRLVGARWSASELIELLDLPAVQRAAGLSDGATGTILQWIGDTNIRWGRDGAMRKEIFNLPAIESNSWRAGLDRLIMGYATGRTRDMVSDIFPHAGDTIGDPHTLGAFAAFVERLFETLASWRTPRTLVEWSVDLRTAFVTMLATASEDEEHELDVVLEAVGRLATIEEDASCARTFELPVVRDWLEQILDDEARSGAFLAGGMTVCALKPMRVVPHRIIAIAGLDDETFPRSHQRPAFDLMSTERRDGDRDRRADDRQLFIDTLLATKDRLILSYVARSAKTNVPRAASVVVAELLDAIDASFSHPDPDQRARTLVEVAHKLQPFSHEYFTNDDATSRLFSYSTVNARALAAAAAEERTERPFFTGALPTDARAGTGEMQLEKLIDCWSNSSRFFCDQALGIRLPGENDVLDECEPMKVDNLVKYKVHDVMLRRHLTGQGRPAPDRAEALALGHLPSGALTGVWYDLLESEFSGFLASLGTQEVQEPLAICVEGTDWSIAGRIDGLTGSGRLQVRPATCGPKDIIRAWITHLALTAAHGPVQTFLIGKDARWTFGEIAEPMPLLDALVEGYRAALTAPLAFFTRASHAFAEQTLTFEKSAASGKASRASKPPIAKARDAYSGSEFVEFPKGDGEDPYVALAWRGRDPFDPVAPFETLALRFWRPALAAMTKSAAEVEA